MPNYPIRWSGHDLVPLPYESVVSCLLRLAWRNVLDHRMLKCHLSDQKNRFVLDLPKLCEQTKWYFDPDRVRGFDRELQYGGGVWLSGQFRYCPVCLEYGYHSDLYQCACLIVCPLHQIPLSTHCHRCGSATAWYEMAGELFHRPYYCHVCRAPISGVPPSIDAHLDFRAAASVLKAALSPYETWWQAMAPRRELVDRLRGEGYLDLQSKWCRSGDLLRGAACKGTPLPPGMRPSAYNGGDIVILSWRYRIVLGDCARHFDRHNSWSDRVRIPTAVYRCTLRLLARWLARRRGWTDAQLNDALDQYSGDDVSGYPVDLLAFFCLRWQLEARFSCDPDMHIFPIESAQLDDRPTIGMASFHGRTPRLGWRAIFLAMYASWHARITKSKKHDLASLRNRAGYDGSYIFSRNRVRTRQVETWHDCTTFNPDEAWFEGEAVLLRIEGMPLLPWTNERTA